MPDSPMQSLWDILTLAHCQGVSSLTDLPAAYERLQRYAHAMPSLQPWAFGGSLQLESAHHCCLAYQAAVAPCVCHAQSWVQFTSVCAGPDILLPWKSHQLLPGLEEDAKLVAGCTREAAPRWTTSKGGCP